MPIKSQYTDRDIATPIQSQADFVQLPFPYLRLYWHNGSPQADKAGNAKYYGGFQIGSDKAREDMSALGVTNLPSPFVESTFVASDGKEYDAFSARAIYAAPIKAKDDWYEEFDQKRGKTVKRHRLDFLVYLGSLTEKGKSKTIEPWGVAVISATGFAASAILRGFKEFIKDTQKIRDEFAPGVPPNFFYCPIGTFGDKRITEAAGESTYVPAQVKQYEWTEGLLASIFVGDEAATKMIELQQLCEEWYNDTHANRAKNFVEQPIMPDMNQLPPIDPGLE